MSEVQGTDYIEWRKQLFATEIGRYETHAYNALTEGYAPKCGGIADFGIIRHNHGRHADGRFHLFHIVRRGGSCLWPGNECYFGHASTEDFVTWTTHDPLLYVRENTWESHHVFAPFPFYFKGRYHIAYTGLNRACYEGIGLAHSDDLFSWERDEHNPVITPLSADWLYSEGPELNASCRDPHVLVEDGTCYLYFTCNDKAGRPTVGCSTSTDLCSWTAPVPVYSKEPVLDAGGGLESSAVHARPDGGTILFFTHWGDGKNQRVLGNSRLEFTQSPRKTLAVEGVTIEVIAKQPTRWLAGTFDESSERLFLYVLHWQNNDISEVEKVTCREQVEPFLN